MRERENAIINRLNKTKVEKHPDLKQEKDDRQRELRKKDQSAQLARVCFICYPSQRPSVDTNPPPEEGRSPSQEGKGAAEVPEGSCVR